MQIVHAHKYSGGIKGYTTFVCASQNNNYSWSYIIGFPENMIFKYTFYFDSKDLKYADALFYNFTNIFITVLFITIVTIIIIGYAFAKKLTKPLFSIIYGIKVLSQGVYTQIYYNNGIYSNVYDCINKLSETLKENKEHRKKLDKMREEWIENISHDLKTPLSSIKGYSEILNTYDLTEEQESKYLEVIMEKSHYMEELLSDLRLTYQLKNDSSILNKKEINLVDLVAQNIIDILNHPDYENRQINFNPENNYITCKIDASLFSRAITNIIYNSLKHNNENIIINISIYKNDKIYIIIEDKDSGISKKNLEKLFSRYYRGTNTNKNSLGSGLGMAIAKQIIEAHKGNIKVESKLNVGTKVIINI